MGVAKQGALLVILAGSCWGMISLFVNYLSAAGLGTMQIAFLRQFLASMVFFILVFVQDRSKLRIKLKDLWLLMLCGLINGVLFNFMYFYTIIHSRASIAVVLLYTSPVFVMIIARVLFGEKITGFKFLALMLTVVGCAFVTGAIGDGYMPPVIAIVTGVLTGLAYALNNIITSIAVRRNDPKTVTLYTFIFSFLFLIPFSGGRDLMIRCMDNPKIPLVGFLMCLVTAVIAQYLFSMGLQMIESGKAAIYGASEPIVGTLVGIFIFHEESNLIKIIGIGMVITAILLIGKEDAEKALILED